jgi:hypothetical protein
MVVFFRWGIFCGRWVRMQHHTSLDWHGMASTSLSHHDYAQPPQLRSADTAPLSHRGISSRHSPLITRHSPLATRHSPLATRPIQYTQRIFDDDSHEEERIADNTATPLETFFFIFALCSLMLYKSTPSKITFRRGRY